MKLIDVRQTPYGKVADVKLETAALSFSMPYAEYCELEAAGRLNDETAIESNVRFMTLIHETRIPYSQAWLIEAEAQAADARDWQDQITELRNQC